ncbi:MAG: RNB domain-containing ribonuclease [SAR324 cluster bacterium]|nr:RNB domain-containing ribonuclease [SAR324 cluster bacterium]
MELSSFIHQYCFFYKDGKLIAGWVEGVQKNKLNILPLQGKPQLLPKARVAVFWRASSPNMQKADALQDLQLLLEEINALAQSQDLEVIHELSEHGKSYEFDELVSDFLENPQDPLQRVGLYLSLESDRRFFKRKNSVFTARTSEELAQIDAKAKREKEQQEWESRIQQWILELETGNWTPKTQASEEQILWIQQLQSVLVYGKNSAYWKSISPLFNLSASPSEDEEAKLRSLLKQAGYPISKGRLLLLRASVKDEFSQELLDAAAELGQKSISHADRRNWNGIPTFTVDSEKTQDYDDAISILEWSESRIEIAIHIADLSGLIQPGTILFEEAESRVSSVYTLKKVFPMFPSSLSNDYFSLKEGNDRHALSFIFNLFSNGESVLKGMEFGVIQVEQNLSYEQADLWIGQEVSFWKILSNCCQELRQKRIEKGALDFARKEVEFDISNPDHIQINAINRNSPANELIEELAILVNQEVGRFFKDHQCPGIYRVQAPYEVIKELKEGEKLSPQHLMIEPARLSVIPEMHAGLGCDYYIQASSPIRRFSDLVTQYQLAQYLKLGKIVFGEEQLMGWAEQIHTTQRTYAQVEREIENHWKLKFLAQHIGDVFFALIKRHLRGGRTEVIFEEIQYTIQVSNLSIYEAGKNVLLKIENVDVERRIVSVSVETEEPANSQEEQPF